MPRSYACSLFSALATLALVPTAGAESLYTHRCEQLTATTSVSEPAAVVPNVEILLRAGTQSAELRRREHVRISAGLADALGLTADDVAVQGEATQIRVSLGSGSPVSNANFTVAEIDDTHEELRLEIWSRQTSGDKNNGFFKLFGTQSPSTVFASPQTATVHGTAPSATYVVGAGGAVERRDHFTEANAAANKQFRECVELHDNTLAVLVPHGGGIETGLSGAGGQVPNLLGDLAARGQEPSVWDASGQWGSGTFERWHVTATQISSASFPGYAELEDSGPYTWAVSLHGFDYDQRAVYLGGRASRQTKCYILYFIESRLDYFHHRDGEITYKVYGPDGDPVDVIGGSPALPDDDDYSGFAEDNIVNRVSPNETGARGYGGIQIELSKALRDDTELLSWFMDALALALDVVIVSEPQTDYCELLE